MMSALLCGCQHSPQDASVHLVDASSPHLQGARPHETLTKCDSRARTARQALRLAPAALREHRRARLGPPPARPVQHAVRWASPAFS